LSLVTSAATKFRFRDFRARVRRTARVFFANANKRGFDGKFALRHRPVGEQKIFFTDAAFRELLRERAVGGRRFAKDHHAAGFLVEPVQDGERGPARFAMPQPVVNALAGVWPGRVRVPAGGLVNHQQMLILKNHARRHAQMKPFFNTQMKAWNQEGV